MWPSYTGLLGQGRRGAETTVTPRPVSVSLDTNTKSVYINSMAKSITVHKKKRKGRVGRPATGHDPALTIRLPKDVLNAATAWGKEEGIASRSETIGRLVELGLLKAREPK
jgi:hypothetical protein